MPCGQSIQHLRELRDGGRCTGYPVAFIHDDTAPSVPIPVKVKIAHGLNRGKGDTPSNMDSSLSDRAGQVRVHIHLSPVFTLQKQVPCMGQPQRLFAYLTSQGNSNLGFP